MLASPALLDSSSTMPLTLAIVLQVLLSLMPSITALLVLLLQPGMQPSDDALLVLKDSFSIQLTSDATALQALLI